MRFKLRHFVMYPPERYGRQEEWHKVSREQAALLLVNLYGWLLPPEHPSRHGLVRVYGESEVTRRETLVRENILPVLQAARQAGLPVIYVADSAPNIGLERSPIRRTMIEHLNIDPLVSYAESGNDPLEYMRDGAGLIDYAPELAPQTTDYYVRKWVYSGFHATWLDRLLRDLRTHTLFCAGFNGDSDLFCTMLEGHWAGYRMVLLRGGYAAVHVPEYEPEMDLTERLALYAEGSLGFTLSVADFQAACVAQPEEVQA